MFLAALGTGQPSDPTTALLPLRASSSYKETMAYPKVAFFLASVRATVIMTMNAVLDCFASLEMVTASSLFQDVLDQDRREPTIVSGPQAIVRQGHPRRAVPL